MAQTHIDHPNSSIRLRAALAAGSAPDPDRAAELISRCAVEPDFFVRDMLTWALTRMPAPVTVPLLHAELDSAVPQARSQALHTLSKIGRADAASTWTAVLALVGDRDDDVARAAWRTVVALVPQDARRSAARALAGRLGHGDGETRRSLSRALMGLDEEGVEALVAAEGAADPRVAEHVADTIRLMQDPDSGLHDAVHEARRLAALGPRGEE
ncbi:HEAT repeat domain-containing protein [Tsukamurella sp. 1534]|uniref:HEAT repeat domain-containing protein n=1 Tax=Tsukamurella sp. 1534 TaxID=1151061 RepID=UPI0002EFD6D6|nr:HEAT repeat domain-containing protein [Tsukamurella sp. 1534]